MHLKLVKINNSKKEETTDDLIGNKIANKITKFWKNLPQNNSKTVTNGHNKQIPKEIYLSSG